VRASVRPLGIQLRRIGRARVIRLSGAGRGLRPAAVLNGAGRSLRPAAMVVGVRGAVVVDAR
jgi:hypothetical protein